MALSHAGTEKFKRGSWFAESDLLSGLQCTYSRVADLNKHLMSESA